MRVVLVAAVFVLVMAFDLRPVQAYGETPLVHSGDDGSFRHKGLPLPDVRGLLSEYHGEIAVFANRTPTGMGGI